ncbi:MAG: hypothetical protein ACK55I_25595, partial [bacterium]
GGEPEQVGIRRHILRSQFAALFRIRCPIKPDGDQIAVSQSISPHIDRFAERPVIVLRLPSRTAVLRNTRATATAAAEVIRMIRIKHKQPPSRLHDLPRARDALALHHGHTRLHELHLRMSPSSGQKQNEETHAPEKRQQPQSC